MNFLYEHIIKEKSKLAVVMCTYRRFENLPKTYDYLDKQLNHDFDFFICDNSGNDPHLLNTTKKKSKNFKHNVFIQEYNNEKSIFGRFYMARDLAKDGYEMIVFIDDDQIIPDSFIDDCYYQYDPNIVKSFYAHYIEGDYWIKQEITTGEEANYVGGGGLLCNAQIFLDDKLFSCPEKYWILDDLWMSYYIANFTNYGMSKLKTDILFIPDDKATAKDLKAMKRKFSDEYIMGKGKKT